MFYFMEYILPPMPFVLQESLLRLKDEVDDQMKARHQTLTNTYQFFQFKSELALLDHWIQEQIALIKTSGIGGTTEECEIIMKETEAFARDLVAREERVQAFGVLSQELMQRHPYSAKVKKLIYICINLHSYMFILAQYDSASNKFVYKALVYLRFRLFDGTKELEEISMLTNDLFVIFSRLVSL